MGSFTFRFSITKVAKKIAAEESDDGEDGKVKPSGESQKAGKSKKDRKKKREEELEAAQLELEQLNNKNNNDDLDDENDEDLEVRKKPAAKKDKKGNKVRVGWTKSLRNSSSVNREKCPKSFGS